MSIVRYPRHLIGSLEHFGYALLPDHLLDDEFQLFLTASADLGQVQIQLVCVDGAGLEWDLWGQYVFEEILGFQKQTYQTGVENSALFWG